MWIAVVPAYNEAYSIGTVVKNIFSCPVDLLLLVANGCLDHTCSEALHAAQGKPLKIIHFSQPLGIDVPKAVGALLALRYKPQGVVFVDGDMQGPLQPVIQDLISSVNKGLDLALTNCYPNSQDPSDLARQVLQAREHLNRQLGLFETIGVATPSHGPHAYSGRLLQKIDLRFLAVPPKAMAQAALHLGAAIGLGASIPHYLLGSPARTSWHAERIAETIIGDCQEALQLLSHTPVPAGIPQGYRTGRRFDILENLLQKMNK